MENYSKKEKNEIGKDEIKNLFKKFGNKCQSIIDKLIDNNNLIDTDNMYEIMI